MEQKNNKNLHILQDHHLAQHLEKLFNEKVLDVFVAECERLIEADIDLREFSAYHKLTFDLAVQYKSMKRIVA